MARKGNTKRPRSVKAEIDENFAATSSGGAVLYEKLFRRMNLRKILGKYLPERSGQYSSAGIAEQVIAGLLLGDKGFEATATVEGNKDLARIFGFKDVASSSTVYRAMCDLAGLEQRSFDEFYRPAPKRPAALDMFGREKRAPKHERIVPDEPERMTKQCFEQMSQTLREVAVACGDKLSSDELTLMGYRVGHGDASDLEVRGTKFQAAKRNHEGNMSLRMLTVSHGPLYLAAGLEAGASDEAGNIVALLDEANKSFERLRGQRSVLMLMDAAYAERDVANKCFELGWKHIICANQQRNPLQRKAEELPDSSYTDLGADPGRGWTCHQVGVFRHQPEQWSQVQRVVVRRWQEPDKLGLWHYSFLYTDLGPEDLPEKKVKKYGYAQLVWMMYSTKQGHEVTYKTLLSDLGMHHPASGRLGATHALILLAAMAANLHSVMGRRVVHEDDRGIRIRRFVHDYVNIAARVVMKAGNTLVVRLAGATMTQKAKMLWLAAYGKVCAI